MDTSAEKIGICVCGWYYHPDLIRVLREVDGAVADVCIIAHRTVKLSGLRIISRDNVGLEWGAYNHYLTRVWQGGPTVYMHDDTVVGHEFFTWIIALAKQGDIHHAFLFSNPVENAYNSGGHGRCMFMSHAFQKVVLSDGGFWYDSENHGFVSWGHYRDTEPPEGCLHHNAAIHRFMRYLPSVRKRYGYDVNRKLYPPALRNGRRGVL